MDAERLVTLKIDARRGHNNVHDCDELLDLLTLAERYLYLRSGFNDVIPVCDVFGEWAYGENLDAAIDAAMKGGE